MQRLLPSILAMIVLSAVTAATAAPTGPTPPAALPDFSARLHGQLAKQPGNLFYSPLSIRMALALAQAGAVGATAAEIKDVVGWGDDPADRISSLRTGWQQLDDPAPPTWGNSNDPDLQKQAEDSTASRRIVLRVANRMWAEKTRELKLDFVALLRDRYNAPMETLDFKNAAEASRAAINAWVSQETKKKIEELIPRGMLTSDTKLVLANAVYFKANWDNPFDPEDTRPGTFHTSRAAKRVRMMHLEDSFRVAHVDNALILEMPYGDGALVMDVVLPDARNGINAIEKRFVAGAFPSWTTKLTTELVKVTFPKFTSRTSFELSDALKAIGVRLAFTYPGADFSAIDGTRELVISHVIHQAFVAVDEKSTEAAATTAMPLLVTSAGIGKPVVPIVFKADHPFLFVIRDSRNVEPIFVGRIVDPT